MFIYIVTATVTQQPLHKQTISYSAQRSDMLSPNLYCLLQIAITIFKTDKVAVINIAVVTSVESIKLNENSVY